MREIKYRAWDKENKMMIFKFDKPNVFANRNGWELSLGNLPDIGQSKCIETILMQYTGLNDKNGKEIYEGDIVNWNEKELMKQGLEKVVGTIAYWIDGFTVETKTVNYSLCGRYGSIEIIGNIYENPELVEWEK